MAGAQGESCVLTLRLSSDDILPGLVPSHLIMVGLHHCSEAGTGSSFQPQADNKMCYVLTISMAINLVFC